MIDVYSITNVLFREAKNQGIKIKSLPKLQSLLFFAHYYFYKNFQVELISEAFYKGKNYPFIPSLERILKLENLIDKDKNFVNDGDIIISFPHYPKFKSSEIMSYSTYCATLVKEDSIVWDFLRYFLQKFGHFSLIELYVLLDRNEKILNIKYNQNPLTSMLTTEEIIKCEF